MHYTRHTRRLSATKPAPPALRSQNLFRRARWRAIAGRDRDGRAAVEGACGWLLTRSWSTSGGSQRRCSGSGLRPGEGSSYEGRSDRCLRCRGDRATVGQQDEDHEKARDPDAGSVACSAVGWGWRPAGGGPVSVRRYRRRAGGGDHRGWGTAGRGGRACGRRDEPSRAERRFGEQLDAGQAGLVVVAVSDGRQARITRGAEKVDVRSRRLTRGDGTGRQGRRAPIELHHSLT